MHILKEPNGYRLEVSEASFNELEQLHLQIFRIFTANGTVIMKLSKQDLADVNQLLMDKIATESCNDEERCVRLQMMIDEFVEADGLHSGYPNTWPWIENF